jgi:hypothetical protein
LDVGAGSVGDEKMDERGILVEVRFGKGDSQVSGWNS